MSFEAKANYPGPFDERGIPLLDYRGRLGPQYNPIAVAQYGLGNHNLFLLGRESDRLRRALAAADWLVETLSRGPQGLWLWLHHFDWDYRETLRAPWRSGLAQGQGISLLVRAHLETGREEYLDAALRAFEALRAPVDRGGTLFIDERGDPWIEEYIVSPPTHILNGFMWALWGVYDLHQRARIPEASSLWERCIGTLLAHLGRYDCGFWSLYEQSGTWMRMLASPFYHRLHIVQLRIMHRLTNEPLFRKTADRWEGYACNPWNRRRARLQKAIFKLLYY
ncbi:MAG TPA: D-glucuronyl C5-epimerase family protein [Planctomycetota bacterium]|nr:D-glucuronyl C5-epimerase family protein [Planctomycetota bacterium]